MRADADAERATFPLEVTGFVEFRGSVRTQHDPGQRQASLGETRLQLELQEYVEGLTFTVRTDLLYDAVGERQAIDLERGRGWLDLREASVAFDPADWMSVKFGRQILTWGTGDLLFLNDMFPKDWQSFFVGRDVEYLKAPSDAVKISIFTDPLNADVVFTPRFDPDRFIQGRRISYYNATLGRIVGRGNAVTANVPDAWFRDAEWALRLWRNVGGVELAGYGYWGRWKSPAGQDAGGRATFPRLNVYGASVRGQLGGGIANAEAAYYVSREDRSGSNPLVDNSQFRLLVGYERDLPEIARDLTVGVQYYLEWMMDHSRYERTLPAGVPAAEQDRHVLTVRLTKKLMNQNLILSLFTYYSPSDEDAYLRPRVTYKIDDHWTVEAGGNVFVGSHDHTFFGQFRRNTNVYAALRYAF
ncbi:MAG: hypothetical protein KGY99_03730 [Phycisphaerae bacterium]|nr:hypothetical protein [Phycisphaerae bacterium]